ncbi:unnamed protein product (macronuclear) [Paramecium tetraurelia]|uniref:Protein kinase domain-containing protein n=1 Tax=Paramecium tetraurelia TaxID=5888 RepID=A0C0T8_PARTE|nr:uncharacterized protein GSPATT00033881001 [Paramecium tetraurelia]CAK64405.1 unnamed protein product [Paramecium tetraurelia]|eukprot:XP_001431803.1 hypothetical protein (macronuclear) [Paramecium tetraurelia strain d4-2]
MSNQKQTKSKQSIIISKKEKQFIAGSDVVYNSLKKLVEQQKEYGNKHSNYVLGIQSIIEDLSTKTFTVTYNCDESAIPLSKIQYSSPKHKIQIFKYLYLIYGFLNKEKILHRNLKPNNIIFYNQQLLLTDFGFKIGDWQIDKINFLDENDGTRKDNMQPYLSPELANIIVSTKSFGHKRDELLARSKLSVQQQDQFAIAIMMLEVFIPLKNRNSATPNERKQQINDMNLSDEFSNDVEKFIKETISNLLYSKDFNEQEFEKRLKMFIEIEQQAENYKINKQELMTQEYDEQVKNVLENKDTQFNLKLLYHFGKTNLNWLLSNIAHNQQNQELITEMRRFLRLYSQIDNFSLDQKDEKFTDEDLFVSLVYLDEKIENLQNSQNQKPHLIMSEEEQVCRNLKQFLKNEYKRLNNLNKNQFKFNKIQDNDVQILKFDEGDFQKNSEVIKTETDERQNDNVQNDQQPNEIEQQNDQQHNQFEQQNEQQPSIQNRQQDNQNVLPNMWQQSYILIPIYSINEQTNQQILLETVKSNFNSSSLQNYFEINKCICSKQIVCRLFKYKDDLNVICLGEIKGNDFEGEVMQLEVKQINQNNSIKTIFHYVNVKTTLEYWNIQNIEQKSSIFQYLEINSQLKFKKCKDYQGQILNGKKNGKGIEKNFIENMIYDGSWKDGYITDGTKKLINTDQILQNAPYKWIGNFEKNELHGDNIKTYLLNYNKVVWLEGRYQGGLKKGVHTCYMKRKNRQNDEIVKIYSAMFLIISNQEHEFKLTCN